MKLSKILSEKGNKGEVFKISEASTLSQAAQLFCKFHVGALLVTQDDRFVGIITERDIIKMCCYESEFYNIKVTELMTEDVVYCKMDDEVEYAMKVMGRHNIRHMPVTEGKEIVGVVSIGDILSELYEADEIVLHDIADLTGATSRNKVF